MDQQRAVNENQEATPIFDAYRRGYDPEQVDRYVGEQRRRLDDALVRASESERKLAAAVGQLRELHRRVAMLEGEERSQSPSLDMLGERVQRILQEAWEGAYALRQSAEHDVSEQREQAAHEVALLRDTASREVAELRQTAAREVAELRETVGREITEQRTQAERSLAELIDAGQRRAELMRAETERRRQAYLERVEEDRERAVGQITYLFDQRQLALGELSRLQATIESTVGEMAKSPLGLPSITSHVPRDDTDLDGLEVGPSVGEMLRQRRDVPENPSGPPTRSMRMPGLEQPISARGAADAGLPSDPEATGPMPSVPSSPETRAPELRDRTPRAEYRTSAVRHRIPGEPEAALTPPHVGRRESEPALEQGEPEMPAGYPAPDPEPRESGSDVAPPAPAPAAPAAQPERPPRQRRVFDFEDD